jgi:hypothetical protein
VTNHVLAGLLGGIVVFLIALAADALNDPWF